MPPVSPKTVLFLSSAADHRHWVAEVLFNSVADRMRLSWRAISRGLSRGADETSTAISPAAIKAMQATGIRVDPKSARLPVSVAADDLASANWIVAIDEADTRPFLQAAHPDCVDRVEFWPIVDRGSAISEIEREIMDLAARLITGGRRRIAPDPSLASQTESEAIAPPTRKTLTAKVALETSGRRGKGVTTVDIPLDDGELRELAGLLKQRCGTGGTVKDGRIEIQGDQRERIAGELQRLGHKVKQR